MVSGRNLDHEPGVGLFTWFKTVREFALPVLHLIGYEPKCLIHCAMAVVRSKSCDDAGRLTVPNPFWSQRTMEEWHLRRSRPDLLPPVPRSEDGDEEVDEKGSSQKRSRSRHDLEGHQEVSVGSVFATPPSWNMERPRDGGGEKGKGGVKPGPQTSGPMTFPEDEFGEEFGEKQSVPEEVDRLQRGLEKEVVKTLHEENLRLKAQVQKLQECEQRLSRSSWSEVSEPPPPPPPPGKWDVRYTPNGTRVPDGLPPDDADQEELWRKMPRWPLEKYETVAESRPCLATMGMEHLMVDRSRDGRWTPRDGRVDRGTRSRQERDLPDLVCGGGTRSRQERDLQDQVCGGGMYSRQERDLPGKDFGRGMYSRQELPQGHDGVMSAAQAKATWLERELASLQKVLNQECSNKHFENEYWAASAGSWKDGVLYQDRAGRDRAQQVQECQRDRAQQVQECQRDRAEQVPECHRDRAQQVPECHHDRAERGDELGGDRVLHGGGVPHAKGGQGQGLSGAQEEGHGQNQGRSFGTPHTGVQQMAGDGHGSGGRVELPSLPDKLNPMELGDWLCLIGPIMRDISVNSSAWWKLTVETAQKFYEEWRHSTPVQRVRINPTLPAELCEPQFLRTEQRGMGLLLRSLTEDIRKVVLANRDLTSTHIVWRLLITFQPGGSGEKGQLLSTLTTMPPVGSAGELATTIRHWRRSFQRAQEIGTSLPDGTLLIKSLETATKYLGQLDSQSAFRLAQSRAELGVDAYPEATAVWQYSQVILAEAETLHLSNAGVNNTTPAPKVKMMQAPFNASSTNGKVCKHWGTEAGCKFGKQCRFDHPVLSDQSARCWLCSSPKHRKNECPHRENGQLPSAIGGSDAPSKGKGKGKGGKGKSAGDKDGPALKAATTTTTSSTPETSSGKGKPGNMAVDSPKQEVMGEGQTLSTSTPAATGETLMGEVAGLLRSLRLQADPPPSIRACQLRKVQAGEVRTCLLDGGATHCLRQVRNEVEWNNSQEVSVALAQGDVVMRQHGESGTLLTRESVQPIVPLSQVAALGYRVDWTSQHCSITHPAKKDLEITMEQNVGMELMDEIEKLHRKFKVMKLVMDGGMDDGSEEQRRWKQLRQLFPEVPVSLLQRVPGKVAWRGENLPFNRHVRRRLTKAKYVVVHVFSGPDDGTWKSFETNEVAVLPLDVSQGADLLDGDLSGFLEDLVVKGKVNLWLSGPPCRSISVSRHQDNGGPPPVRGRSHDRFGLPGLSNFEEALVNGDGTLWLKNLWWMWLAHQHQEQVEFLLEQPQDPMEWKDQNEEYPSFTVWPETDKVVAELGLKRTRVQQGALGHLTMKPTVLLNSLPEIQVLDGLQVAENFQSARWPEGVKERIQFSRRLAAWAPGLKQVIGEAIRARARQDPKLSRMTKAEKDTVAGWQAHFDCGHLPFRHDCSVCLQSAGKDRPRKTKQVRSSFCMSVDIAGPFQPGVDQVYGASPRYFLVANVAIPVDEDGPMVKGLQDLGFRLSARDPQAVELEEEVMVMPEGTDPMATQAEVEEVETPEVDVAHRQEAEQRWKEFLTMDSGVESRLLTFAVPLVSRKAQHVVEAVAWVYARVRSMHIPILRLHTDRAREFSGASFARWCAARDIMHTMSPGDEPTQNARVERTIGLLKNRVRTLIKASGAMMTWWPLALRHAGESMLREQLWQLGIATPKIPVFGAHAVAKSKTWHHRGVPWKFPGTPVRIWGPACDMSLTSGGVLVQDTEGRWLRTTVARPIADPEVDAKGKVVASKVVEDEVPNNRCGGSSPMTSTPATEEAAGNQQGDEEFDASPPGESTSTDLRLKVKQGLKHPQRVFGAEDIWEHFAAQVKERSQAEPPGGQAQDDIVVEPVVYSNTFPAYDPPRYRLHGKQAEDVNNRMSPALRVTRAGGEWSCGSLEEGLKLLQHQGLKQLVEEDASRLQDGRVLEIDSKVIQEVHRSLNQLEKELTEMNDAQSERIKIKAMKVEEEEVLQTQTIGLDVVRQNLQDWIPAFQTEVDSILSTGAMEVISDEKYRELLRQHPDLERLPMLAVATKKPPSKRKGRIVVCGNHSSKQLQPGEPDPSVGGIDTVGIRCILNLAAQRDLEVASLDVKGAFLQAPRRSLKLRPTVCDPPQLIKQMGLSKPTDKWLVHKALYGFIESPSDWSAYRNDTMRDLQWCVNNQVMQLQQTSEPHIWRVRNRSSNGEEDVGYVAVYVDDLLLAVTGEHLQPLITALRKAWTCSEPEVVTLETAMRFCGFEIKKIPGGLQVGQEGFATEMLKRRQVTGMAKFPLPAISDGEDESPIDPEAVKRAQGIVGELNWLTTRSRPDLAYSVGLAARLIHRRPHYVLELCDHMMRYVNSTKDLALVYVKCGEGDLGDHEELQVAKGLDTLQIFSDASFGPVHERGRSVSGCLVEHANGIVAWDSQSQPFISQSTAEAEVISYNLAYQVGEGVSSLLQELGFPTSKQLYGDSKSGIAVISSECGPWRTRHLRLRSSKLRELVQNPAQPWSIRHLSGQLLVADGLTKVLVYQGFEKFKNQLRMKPMQRVNQVSMNKLEIKPMDDPCGLVMKLLAAVGGVLCGSSFTQLGALLVLVAILFEVKNGKKSEGVASTTPENKEKELGPKVRAFRVLHSEGPQTSETPESERESSEMSGQGGKGVRARGRDAMAMHDLAQGMGGLRISTEVTLNINTGGVEGSARSSSSTTREESARMRASTTRVAGEAKAKASATRRGYAEPTAERSHGMEIWNQERFMQAPRGADQWQVDLLEAGWLVRTHGSKGRVRPFHPLHRSCPLPATQLQGDRITVVFSPLGGREVLADEWTIQRTWQRPGPWRGFTLLRTLPSGSATLAADGAEAEGEVSDGSYEQVTD